MLDEIFKGDKLLLSNKKSLNLDKILFCELKKSIWTIRGNLCFPFYPLLCGPKNKVAKEPNSHERRATLIQTVFPP